MRGNKRKISYTLSPGIFPQIDQAADNLGISRAAWVSMTTAKALKTIETRQNPPRPVSYIQGKHRLLLKQTRNLSHSQQIKICDLSVNLSFKL